MAPLIEYYIPNMFVAPRPRWVPESERGKIIEFHSALAADAQPAAMAVENARVAVAPQG